MPSPTRMPAHDAPIAASPWRGAAPAPHHPRGPLPAGAPAEVLGAARDRLGPALPRAGVGERRALDRLGRLASELGLDLTHPFAAAHLQPPVLEVAVEADRLASAGNASMDTYDSGPATLAVEQWVVDGLARLAGLPAGAAGVMTPGGSMSNLLGLMLARDAAVARHGGDARSAGVGSLVRPVVLCSQLAHFSVHRACAALGLGEDAVVAIPVDDAQQLRVDVLRTELARTDRTPVAVVATAGTTDHGAVDPLHDIADACVERGVWLHVDAAYGFGALFSERLRGLLDGVDRADSVTLDLHKLGWLPAPASVLLVGDPAAFRSTERVVDYLIPEDDLDAGLAGLLGRSLQTTRRPDCLKVAAALQAYGTSGLGEMVDRCHDLALAAERAIAADPRLELVAGARLTTVLFRCVPPDGVDADAHQARVRRALITSGRALVGRTRTAVGGAPATVLKLTLMNPGADASDIGALLDLVAETGRRLADGADMTGRVCQEATA